MTTKTGIAPGLVNERVNVEPPPTAHEPLRILHCFRSPVGGIFRHVRDLVGEQVRDGHSVGIICDNNTGGAFENTMLAGLEPQLALGLNRVPMDRAIRLSDAKVAFSLFKTVRALDVDVIHSHGAKGGAYARFIGAALKLRGNAPAIVYCPHGGSMHFEAASRSGRVYFMLERLMERITDRLVFVSAFERDAYLAKVGTPHCPTGLVRNGLAENEFEPVKANTDAADFLYIGMMRDLKGVDVFLDALAEVERPVSAVMVGDGPDLAAYKQRAEALPSHVSIEWHKPMPARAAFRLGRTVVVPSRAESMPYIVLEAIAAKKPLIATRVGGIPEITGPHATNLVAPDDVAAMARALDEAQPLASPDDLAALVHEGFNLRAMAASVMDAYRASLSVR